MFHRHFFEFERHSRMFEKGDLKYVILGLLKEKPSHGYEIIRALENSFHGFYTPSAGSVYPTLQMLEDMEFVNSSEHDGKKVYSINASGKEFLEEKKEVIDKIKNHMEEWWNPRNAKELYKTVQELRHLGRLLRRRVHDIEPEKWASIGQIASRACRDIESIIEKR